jgi:hypothetical protein
MVDNITSNLKMHKSVIITTEGDGSLNCEVGHSSNLCLNNRFQNGLIIRSSNAKQSMHCYHFYQLHVFKS